MEPPAETPKDGSRKLKVPKGTRDFGPFQMAVREKAFQIITACFKRHGAVAIDTPVFELKETLLGKYGEDSKLIYDLADQGGELLSLRYDLTVPFARYVAMNNISSIKRYHIARVYRRDNPAMSRGRFREFYQCDYDIAGDYDLMLPDADCLRVIYEILSQLPLGDFLIKVNHRKILDGMMEMCGVPSNKFRSICSAIDKLDKEPWIKVREEMISKGLDPNIADALGKIVILKGKPLELYKQITSTGIFTTNEVAQGALAEMAILFRLLGTLQVLDKVEFDLSLARGLDYYTGLIFEAVLTGGQGLGSITGGGRYDKLVGMFHPHNKQIPAVGFSVGIERILSLMEEAETKNPHGVRAHETEVLVVSVGSGMTEERLQICSQLWDNDIKAEFLYFEAAKLQKALDYANNEDIPLLVIIGPDEKAAGTVKIKDMAERKEEAIPQSQLVTEIKKHLKVRKA